MSAETLRRAATELRATVRGVDGDPRLVADPDFKLAVADWLDSVASTWDIEQPREYRAHALNLARLCLGEGPL